MTDLLTEWYDEDTGTVGAHPDYRHRWDDETRPPGAQVRTCDECGAREAYWSDDDYGHEACPSAPDPATTEQESAR